jgi:hypothetical protein
LDGYGHDIGLLACHQFVIDPASRNEVISNKGIGLQNNKE